MYTSAPLKGMPVLLSLVSYMDRRNGKESRNKRSVKLVTEVVLTRFRGERKDKPGGIRTWKTSSLRFIRIADESIVKVRYLIPTLIHGQTMSDNNTI